MAVSGGFRTTVGGLRVSARSPLAVTIAAAVAALAWYVAARRAQSVRSDLEQAWGAIDRHALAIVCAVTASIVAATAYFSTYSASGADASGYLSEAVLWSTGRMFLVDPLWQLLGASDPFLTTPLGWRPAPTFGLQAPTYPPGLPLLMAVPHALGGIEWAQAIVVLSAGLTVFAAGSIARSLAGGAAGAIAAVLIAVTPVFLHQSMQPMSDVPVTAAWLLGWLVIRRSPALAGVAMAVAILIRPNLAPLAVAPLLLLARSRSWLPFSAPIAIAGVVLAWLQWQWYGSPLRSGYGVAQDLYAFGNIGPNVLRYSSWILGTAPLFLVAPAGIALVWPDRFSRMLAGFTALAIAVYLPYGVFEEWTYLRFLLPAFGVAAVFVSVAVVRGVDRLAVAARPVVWWAVLLVVVGAGLGRARALDTFRLADQQRRVEQIAGFLRDQPAETVTLAGEQSGSLRYYTGRPILRWEAATPDSLARALVALDANRRPVVIALDAWEEPLFRTRFGGVAAVSLDWPPAADAGTSHRTRVWRLSDRERFLRGERVETHRTP